MLIEIYRDDLTLEDIKEVRMCFMRNHIKGFDDGLWHSYVTRKQLRSILNCTNPMWGLKYLDSSEWRKNPLLFGIKFHLLQDENEPARFYGKHPHFSEDIEIFRTHQSVCSCVGNPKRCEIESGKQ